MRQPDYNAATCYTTFKDGAWRLMDGHAKEVYCFKDEEEKKAIAQTLVDNIWNAYTLNNTVFLIEKRNKKYDQFNPTKKFYLNAFFTDPYKGVYEFLISSDSIKYLKMYAIGMERAIIYRSGNPGKPFLIYDYKLSKWV